MSSMIPDAFAFDASAFSQTASALAQYGFAGMPSPSLSGDLHRELLAEAETMRGAAWSNTSNDEIDQQVMRAELGPLAAAFLDGPGRSMLESLVGEAAEVSRESSCYTYYDAAEARLGTHLDRDDSCAFTLIVYLSASHEAPEPGPGLTLEIFAPDHAEGDAPIHVLPTTANSIAIGHGSRTPHRRPSLAQGERVIALTACFHRSAVSHNPGDPELQALIEQGATAWTQGDLALAGEKFSRALERNAAAPQALSGIGHVYWSSGDFETSRQAFKAAADVEGDDPGHWCNIGLAHRDLKQFDQAIMAFRAALTLSPGYAPALNEWGNTLQDMGAVSDSVAFYERSLASDSSRAVVHHNLGTAWMRMGQDVLASDCFQSALRLDPHYHHSLEELGALYARHGDNGTAQALLNRAGTERAQFLWAEISAGLPDQHAG